MWGQAAEHGGHAKPIRTNRDPANLTIVNTIHINTPYE
jgi:hypothetical protein